MAARTASSGRAATGRSAASKAAPSRAVKSVAIPQLPWHQVRPAPIVLVSGTEVFLAERAVRQLRDFLKLEDPSLEISDIQADSYAPGELLTMASPSLFGEPRLIRVSSVEKCSDTFLTEALAYLENPAEDTYVVLRHGGGVRGKKLLDTIRSGAGGAVEVVCAELKKDSDRHDFASAEFKAAGKRVTPSALRSLVAAFSGDLAELSAACQQLIADSASEVTETTVDRYYGGRVEANAFKVADSAIAGRHGEALVILRHALSSGADPVPVVAAFAMKIRTMAKLYGVRGGSGQLASQFGLAPWQVERAQRDLSGWSDEGLARCMVMLAETDAAVKGAGRDPVFALERLVGVIARRGEG
ncbi:DNA polymerase III subunit delta [Cryobacterium fucosi]|uniref:DNA-directed DNA polymerase n=1 Tax=Cryobacterium fucosi TaxID=1259157 RepID=A0A4R9AVZ0_9MICO|nr:DNA polymerase III subunit delta [Cryobacterium fucosi]